MEWLLANPQIYSAFTALGSLNDGGYVVGDNCLELLKEIILKLSTEDHTLRTFRRAIGFGNNIKKDIVPLLINATDTDVIDEIITLLVNLTIPVECLMSVEVMRRTEIGRHTIYDLNNLLVSAKEAFSNSCATKALVDRMKAIFETDKNLSVVECNKINHCLLLLRNILHVSEGDLNGGTSVQNRIIWNLFTQSIDKLILHMINCEQSEFWAVTVIQLIALMYKDQHVSTLQKMLNVWFEASMSESSEDDESTTSPSMQCGGDSSPMLTSDPTSDSSDTGNGNRKSPPTVSEDKQMSRIELQNSLNRVIPRDKQMPPRTGSEQTETSTDQQNNMSSSGFGSMEEQSMSDSDQQTMASPASVSNMSTDSAVSASSGGGAVVSKSKKYPTTNATTTKPGTITTTKPGTVTTTKTNVKKITTKLEHSDWGYGIQVENLESISTSSNEDEFKPVHQKPPPNQKQRYNAANNPRKPVTVQEKRDLRRKKLAKRSRSSIINMKGIMHDSPTDEDISNVLKEFTVDFLLKGYGALVKQLYAQHLKNFTFKIDTSHFFWLITNFLKFATQLELELDLIKPVMSYEILSFLTYEGVSLSETLELEGKQNSSDLETHLRRLHLVITAVREILQALDQYNKNTHLSQADKEYIRDLRLSVANIQDLRSMFVLLIRCYNPFVHKKQYLQELVITNHILLSLLDDVAKSPDFIGFPKHALIIDHIRQFATVEIMHHYGLLLENFRGNGEFVNDCIFTMMHHVGGDLGQASILFQPGILKTYSNIWDSDYGICEDWSDLIEYVIHKFINTPQQTPLSLPNPIIVQPVVNIVDQKRIAWAKEEMDTLYWYYIHSKSENDVVGSIIKLFKDNINRDKSRIEVIQQLLRQDIISLSEFDNLMIFEDAQYVRTTSPVTQKTEELMNGEEQTKPVDDIKRLKDRLLKENKGSIVQWLQKVLMECCFVKLKLYPTGKLLAERKQSIMEPIPFYSILKNQPVPIVPWNSEQHSVMLYQPFILLLHKLGFLLPDDSNRLWVCIPNCWTAEILCTIAGKLGTIDNSFFKFDSSYFDGVVSVTKNNETIVNDEQPPKTMETYLSPRQHPTSSIIRYTPEPYTKPRWLEALIKAKGMSADGLLHFENDEIATKHPLDHEQLATVMNPIFYPCVTNKRKSPKLQQAPSLERIIEPQHEETLSECHQTTATCHNQVLEENTDYTNVRDAEMVSASENESVTSELIKCNLMYVSDEEDTCLYDNINETDNNVRKELKIKVE